MPFALWGPSRARTALAAVAASAAALVPAVMVGSPAQATSTVLSIGAVTVAEGGTASFTLTYTGSSAATYNLSLAGGSATNGTDYTNTINRNGSSTTSVAFTGAGTATVTVATTADTTAESNETFDLTAVNASDANDTTSGTATITDDFPSFALSASTTSVAETVNPPTTQGGSPTAKTVTITATLTAPSTHNVTIPVSTVDGTANSTAAVAANRDFTALNATNITINAGDVSGSTTVTITDDALDEDPTQYFDVTAGSATGATVVPGTGTVRINIQDDDATPAVNIGGAGVAVEGNPLVFPLTLTGRSEKPVSVDVSTANGVDTDTTYGATAGSDYTALTNSTVTFAPTATLALASVTTTNDTAVESSPESLSATISNPVNATLGTTVTATGGINDNEPAPTAALSPANFAEGNSGEAAREITVTLGSTSSIPVKINYTFTGGTATAGTDYRGTAGSITIPAGSTTGKIPVTIVGDTTYESPDETFTVVLSSPNNSVATGSLGAQTITITDTDDVKPTWTVGNVAVMEGNAGVTVARVPFTLSGPTNVDVSFATAALTDVTTSEAGTGTGTNAGGNDYDAATNATVTIPAGSTTGYLEIPVNGDTVYEHDETATVSVSSISAGSANVNATVPVGSQHTSTLTIQGDDVAPTMVFNPTSGSEGTTLRISGTVTGVSQYPYTVAFAVAGSGADAATSGTDFDATTIPSLSVARGETGRTFADTTPPLADMADIYLLPDNIDEPTESFTVSATESTSTLTGFTTGTGTYRINDDPGDLPPSAAIRDETIQEDEGSVDVHVDLSVNGDATSTTQTVTIPYWTVDGSAKAGQDYTATRGTLTLPPGETTKSINVPILNDSSEEGAESFFVKLGTPGPSGAAVTKSTGEVTIAASDGGSGEEPGGEEPGEAPKPTIKAPAKVTGPSTVEVEGIVAPGAKVELWGGAVGSGALKPLDTDTADEDGYYWFERSISTGYRFAVLSQEMKSGEAVVWMTQKPIFVVSTSTKGQLNLGVKGNPAWAGQTAAVQQWKNGGWVTIRSGKTGADGVYRVGQKFASGSSVVLRAWVGGEPGKGTLPAFTAQTRTTVK
ncbi:Calx-beta domain-containing protein [Actinoplanes sp. URMC 104]|uniref:Calx-beta domain-containing protein n=1 Tax=Actinoplanes sp. URMC 104 TaxID=3423409 RepID=UPI003F1E1126